MRNKIDIIDVNILEGLAKYGPRNITKIAREVKIPRGTILSRIKHMSSSFYLRLLTNVYHTNLGMKKAVVFANANPGHEDLLLDFMKVNEFYIYLSRCYGLFEGCIGIYVIPVEHTEQFLSFLQEIKDLGIVRGIRIIWSTCFHTVNRTSKWFDDVLKSWIFPWNEWLHEIQSKEGKLPYTLKDPERFIVRADETDIYILKELEKDATISLGTIARELGTTLQNVHYHFKKHVVKNGLIETFQIAIVPFERTMSEMVFFVFDFNNNNKMAKFAQSLLDKPFVYILGKVLGESRLVAQVYLPKMEFRNLIDALSQLIRDNYLKSFDYLIQDLRSGKWLRETIPYQCFKNGKWVYDHEKHIKGLHKLVNNSTKKMYSIRTT